MDNLNKIDVKAPIKGMWTDGEHVNQPDGTYSFALNQIQKEEGFVENEEGFIANFIIPTDFIVLGNKYLTNNRYIAFLINLDNTQSEIGIFTKISDTQQQYTSLVKTSLLEFNKANPIKCEVRIRRNQVHVYWVDGLHEARSINIDNLRQHWTSAYATYIDGGGNPNLYGGEKWNIQSFELIKKYSSIPTHGWDIDVKDSGGSILAGSYNFSIQYVDENNNGTNWVHSTQPINIYNDRFTEISYHRIRGSKNTQNDIQNFSATTKSIRLKSYNLDKNFPYYRVAIICANGVNGIPNKVLVSERIPINVDTFNFTGNEASYTETSLTDIYLDRTQILAPKYIEQLENRLILANTKENNYNWCDFQKYASKIKSYRLTQETELNKAFIKSNTKNPSHNITFTGYMPGEVYSFGIVYIMADYTISPAFHIVGRSSTDNNGMDFYEMNYTYLDIHSCNGDYWGTDWEGNSLEGQFVRHHKFPFRKSTGHKLAEKFSNGDIKGRIFRIGFDNIEKPHPDVIGFYIVQHERTDEDKVVVDTAIAGAMVSDQVKYTSFSTWIQNMAQSQRSASIERKGFYFLSPEHQFLNKKENFDKVVVEGAYGQAVIYADLIPNDHDQYPDLLDVPTWLVLPPMGSTHARAVMTENVQAGTSYNQEYHKKKAADDDGFDLAAGYNSRQVFFSFPQANDVFTDDVFRVGYLNAAESFNAFGMKYYNTAWDTKIGMCLFENDYFTDARYNQFTIDTPNPYTLQLADSTSRLLYVSLVKDNKNGYSDFLSRPYYKARTDPYYFGNQNLLNGASGDYGDVYIGSMNLISTFFYQIQVGNFEKKNRVWQIIVGAVLIVAGIILSVISGGASLALTAIGIAGLGTLAITYGVSLAMSGIKFEQAKKMIDEDYTSGLLYGDRSSSECFFGDFIDDTIKWFSSRVTDVFVESSVNVSLRCGVTAGITDFLDSPSDSNIYGYDKYEFESYLVDKLTVIDHEQGSGRLFKGYPSAEVFDINPDFQRKDREKRFYPLADTFDCCNLTDNAYKNRVHYSQQSFQEELSDNYRAFLPNNYRDVESGLGQITNLFRQNNKLYIHTEEGLFYLPANLQERVNNDLISFIGTGEFFSHMPILLSNENIGNLGSINSFGTTETPHGIVFISSREGKVYLLKENGLEILSDRGMSNFFKENSRFKLVEDFKALKDYDLNPDTPQSLIGFYAAYDAENDRLLITKRDYEILPAYRNALEITSLGQSYLDDKLVFTLYDYGFKFNDGDAGTQKELNIENTTPSNTYYADSISYKDYLRSRSFTLSYSFRNQSWSSYHSYLPSFYMVGQNELFSGIISKNDLYKHNSIVAARHNYYQQEDSIIELVLKSNDLDVKTWENIMIDVVAKKIQNETTDDIDRFFTTVLLYNSKQNSTELDVVITNKNGNQQYLSDRLISHVSTIQVDKIEKFWRLNGFRDFVSNYSQASFSKKWDDIKGSYFIDKVIDSSVINMNKEWYELQNFRDKYLVIRLKYSNFNFDSDYLITRYILSNEQLSLR